MTFLEKLVYQRDGFTLIISCRVGLSDWNCLYEIMLDPFELFLFWDSRTDSHFLVDLP